MLSTILVKIASHSQIKVHLCYRLREEMEEFLFSHLRWKDRKENKVKQPFSIWLSLIRRERAWNLPSASLSTLSESFLLSCLLHEIPFSQVKCIGVSWSFSTINPCVSPEYSHSCWNHQAFQELLRTLQYFPIASKTFRTSSDKHRKELWSCSQILSCKPAVAFADFRWREQDLQQ